MISYNKPRQSIKKQTSLCRQSPSSQSYGFSSGHVQMWELDYKESWAPKNSCFRIVVLEKTLESPLDCKGIKPVHPKRDQSWIFIGRTDGKAEAPILWPPDGKNWLIGKDPDAGKDWRQEEKGVTEDEMVGWHHWLSGMSLSKLQEILKDREAWRAVIQGVAKSRTRLRDWTELKWCQIQRSTMEKKQAGRGGVGVGAVVWTVEDGLPGKAWLRQGPWVRPAGLEGAADGPQMSSGKEAVLTQRWSMHRARVKSRNRNVSVTNGPENKVSC